MNRNLKIEVAAFPRAYMLQTDYLPSIQHNFRHKKHVKTFEIISLHK